MDLLLLWPVHQVCAASTLHLITMLPGWRTGLAFALCIALSLCRKHSIAGIRYLDQQAQGSKHTSADTLHHLLL